MRRVVGFSGLLALACVPTPVEGGTEETGETTSAGETTTSPTTGTVVEPGSDYEAMDLCGVPEACDPFEHALMDGVAVHAGPTPGFIAGERCILAGLREGTPGRYVVGAVDTRADGWTSETAILHVTADRRVTFAARVASGTIAGVPQASEDVPAQTCSLREPLHFSTCLTEHDDASHYAACMLRDGWWTGCAASGPGC